MKKKQPYYFLDTPTPPPSPPPSPASSPLPAPIHPCLQQAPTLGPHSARLPSLASRSPLHLGARKPYRACRPPRVPCSPCSASPPSSAPLGPVRLASFSALHSSFALDLPSGPSLASGHLGRLLTCRYSPLAQSPSPAISPPLDHPVNCPQGLVYLPVGTRTSQNFVHQAPAGGKEQPVVGGCRAGWFPLQHSRKPPSPQ